MWSGRVLSLACRLVARVSTSLRHRGGFFQENETCAPCPVAPGTRMLQDKDIADTLRPQSINPLGNYAVQITWEDGFNQVGHLCYNSE